MGVLRIPRASNDTRHCFAGLQFRSAPRGGCRPYRRNRQRHPQTHAGRRPVSIGLWFSLGHSAVVALAAFGIAITMTEIARFDWFKDVGGVISTLVSTSFLLAIATMNIVILVGIWNRFRDVRRGGTFHHHDLDLLLT